MSSILLFILVRDILGHGDHECLKSHKIVWFNGNSTVDMFFLVKPNDYSIKTCMQDMNLSHFV